MIKYSIYKYLQELLKILKKLTETITSIIAVLIFSKKFNVRIPKKNSNELVVLGNGPSINELYKNNKNFLISKDTIATNDFARSDLFKIIKPNFYTIADPLIFNDKVADEIKKRSVAIFQNINEADWTISLYVPFKYKKYIEQKINNKNVTIFYFNHTPCSGFEIVVNYLFDKKLGMPYLKNILIAALILGIYLRYKNIYLWGVDHDWMKYMVLNKDNILCLNSHHFYDEDKQEVWYKEDSIPWNVSEALSSMAKMFNSYEVVNAYAKKKEISILNQTQNSMIDAFPFKTIKNYE
jgi:hypothetical protein